MPDPPDLPALRTGHVREGRCKARRSAHASAPVATGPPHPHAMIHMAFLPEPRLHTAPPSHLISMRFAWVAAPPAFYALHDRTIDHRVASSAR